MPDGTSGVCTGVSFQLRGGWGGALEGMVLFGGGRAHWRKGRVQALQCPFEGGWGLTPNTVKSHRTSLWKGPPEGGWRKAVAPGPRLDGPWYEVKDDPGQAVAISEARCPGAGATGLQRVPYETAGGKHRPHPFNPWH